VGCLRETAAAAQTPGLKSIVHGYQKPLCGKWILVKDIKRTDIYNKYAGECHIPHPYLSIHNPVLPYELTQICIL